MFVSRYQSAGQNHNIKISNKSFWTIAFLKDSAIFILKQDYPVFTSLDL
jgi:hypothetical protein